MIQNNYCQQSPRRILKDWKDKELWSSKLEEIRNFQREEQDPQISVQQAEELIRIYNRYKHIFSDAPGKVKDYQCRIRFKEPVDFKKKSYPIAYSQRNAVRAEINQMMEDDIIELSQSPYTSPIEMCIRDRPYTSPIVAIPKKDGKVRICLDAREINKMIVNDRTSPGEIEEILKNFHGTKYISA